MRDVVGELVDEFVHLHVHSYYSLLDGAASPETLVEVAKEKGFEALAITDHGNMTGHLDFYDACRQAGIKPIIGNELYFTYDISIEPINYPEHGWDKKNYHLIVLAKNNIGYQNLIKLSSMASIKGLYDGKPRCDLNLLREYKEGLIITSACLGGIIQSKLIDFHEASNSPETFKVKLFKRMGWKEIVPKTSGRGKNKVTTYTEEQEADLKVREAAMNPEKYMMEARYYIEQFRDIFGKDFYLEIQTTTEEIQSRVNFMLVELSQEYGIELIVTSDVHYARAEDHDFHDSVLCVSMKKLKAEENRMRYKPCYHILTKEEVYEYLDYLPVEAVQRAISNTWKIAQQCDVHIEYGKIPFPDPGIPKGVTAEKHLENLTYKGLYRYALAHPYINVDKYREQIDYELRIINDAGFAPYFLVVRDYIQASNERCNCPTGPGRGSGAGSLVTFLNGITRNVDPIKNGLLFERFLNAERIEEPDIDTDFEYMNRQGLVNYVYDKYGRDCVSKIMTITREGIKYALKDAARVLGYEASVINALVKQLPVLQMDDVDTDDYDTDIITPEALGVLHIIKEQYSDVYELAMRLYGMPRSYGMHASGLLIAGEPIMNHIPLKLVTDKETGETNIVTQLDADPVHKLGGVKFDILGLKTLSVLQYAIQLTGQKIDLSKIDFNDPEIYKLVHIGNTEGIFQMESALFKKLCKEMKPTCFNDISALVALGRPGPLGAGLVDKYIARKHGKERVEYDFDELSEIEEDTYGVFVYQEQLMQAAQILSGYSLGQADLGIRKPMSKKKEDLVNRERTYFVYGKKKCPNPADPLTGHKHCTLCNGTGYVATYDNPSEEVLIPGGVNMGFDEEKLNALYDQMTFFGQYAFNRSHSACYAVIACQTMYMKTYHLPEFMAALISFAPNAEKIGFYLDHCKELGIEVLMPDINKSYELCTVENGAVRLGFSLIKGVSGGASYIIEERAKGGEFKSFEDFYYRINKSKINKTKFEALIKAGCFGSLNTKNAHQLINAYLDLKEDKKTERLHPVVTKKEAMTYELELFGTNIIYVSNFQKKKDGDKLSTTGIIVGVRTLKDKREREMAFITIETKEDTIECVIFATTYAKCKDAIYATSKIQVSGKKDKNKIVTDSIKAIEKESA